MEKVNIEFLHKNNLIILDAISGSHAYGTNTPNSDLDKRGVFVLPEEYIDPYETLDGFVSKFYVEQINDEKNDITYYELRRFLQLINNNNPNILELLNVPNDCIIKKHKVFNHIEKNRHHLITKLCKYTFTGYINEQIRKATGLNKKQRWALEKFERKSPIDFCYIIEGCRSKNLKEALELRNMDTKFCGLVKIPNTPDNYALFYDWDAHSCFSETIPIESRESTKSWRMEDNLPLGHGYKGIETDNSNNIRLSSVPQNSNPLFIIYYNQAGYSSHCRDYKEYQTWLNERNEARYTDFESHGQGLDGKNMLHCRRLLDMAKEIALGKGIIVKRDNAPELLKIRKGEVSLREILEHATTEVALLDDLYDKSNLPDRPDIRFMNELLRTMRQEFYASIKEFAL